MINRGNRPFLLLVLFFSLYLAYLVLRPFLHTIILAVVLASLFHPLHLRFLRLYRGRGNLAALTVMGIIVFLCVIPLALFTFTLIREAVTSLQNINDWISQGNLQKLLDHPAIAPYTVWLRARFTQYAPGDLQDPLLQASKSLAQFVLSHGADLVGNVAGLVSNFLVMVFLGFYLVRDGAGMLKEVKALSPLREEQEDRILHKVRAVSRSALQGSFLTGLCQGIAGGIGFAIVGIPPFFWGTCMGFASMIPVVGTAFIWVPAVGYLALLGQWKSTIFLLLWSIIVVGSIDNFLRPFLMRGEGGMSPFYVFLAILGGIHYFGLVGILYGPLILGFANVMLHTYSIEYRDLLADDSSRLPISTKPFP